MLEISFHFKWYIILFSTAFYIFDHVFTQHNRLKVPHYGVILLCICKTHTHTCLEFMYSYSTSVNFKKCNDNFCSYWKHFITITRNVTLLHTFYGSPTHIWMHIQDKTLNHLTPTCIHTPIAYTYRMLCLSQSTLLTILFLMKI